MKTQMLLVLFILSVISAKSQNLDFEIPSLHTSKEVKTDGHVQPFLTEFIEQCKKYGISYHDKLFQLKEIAVVDTLTVSPKGGTLGMVVRNKNNDIDKIIFSWMTLLDKEILKVVAFHEFGHHFLGYKHVCDDCNTIMARINTSYFDIIKDWDYHVEQLFINAPAYIEQKNKLIVQNN